jgi:transposase-like protein/predicted RNA-binding Zn-ribbon protein involved in translation (DUF1610 family)
MNLIDVTKQFATEEQCLAYLEAMRWPDGVRCPVCGNNKISRITRKSRSKNVRKSLYQCLEPTCKQQFSATAGTIFADSHLPLQKWFMALAIVVDAKKGISANQLKQHLGIGSYRTAWYMAHRIRKAMEGNGSLLSGVVEVDETYIGGKAKRRGQRARNQKTRSEKFDMVVGMREREGRVKFVHVPDGKAASIRKAVDAKIAPTVEAIYTDSAAVYDFSFHPEMQRKRETVNHSIQWIVPGSLVHTNTVESSFSLLKRGLIGNFRRVSIKHLQRYLHEFEFRFNIRKDADRFSTTLRRMLNIPPMPYVELIAVSKTEA